MAVSKSELLCYEYFNLISDMTKYPGMYSLDKMRSKMHCEILDGLNLTRDDASEIFDDLDKYNAKTLYIALLELRNNKYFKEVSNE